MAQNHANHYIITALPFVKLLADGTDLKYAYADKTLTVELLDTKRIKLVDLEKILLETK